MKNSPNQIKPKKIAAIALAIALIGLAYYQYQAYETERKLDIEREKTVQRLRDLGKQLAEENRRNPIKFQQDPLAQEGNPFGAPPSDAEEIAQIKLWHQSSPEQRKKLVPTTDKALDAIEETAPQTDEKIETTDQASTIDEQSLLTVQMQALAAKNKQNTPQNK